MRKEEGEVQRQRRDEGRVQTKEEEGIGKKREV